MIRIKTLILDKVSAFYLAYFITLPGQMEQLDDFKKHFSLDETPTNHPEVFYT